MNSPSLQKHLKKIGIYPIILFLISLGTLLDTLIGSSSLLKTAESLSSRYLSTVPFWVLYSLLASLAITLILLLSYRKKIDASLTSLNSTPRISVEEFERECKELTERRLKELYASEEYKRFMKSRKENYSN